MYTVEQLKEDLLAAMPANIVSLVLYGSAAIHDTTKRYSDINTFLIVQDAGLATLQVMEPYVRRWCKQGNPPPLVMSLTNLRNSQDVFAIEFSDIRASHLILHGIDPFAELEPRLDALRHQLEFELRSKMLLLQRNYFELGGQAKQLHGVMAKSLSSFTVLAKTMLRLANQPVPEKKMEVWKALSNQLNVDTSIIEIIIDLRQDKSSALKMNADALFGQYLALINRMAEHIDKFLVKK